jgi:hypothetical protein
LLSFAHLTLSFTERISQTQDGSRLLLRFYCLANSAMNTLHKRGCMKNKEQLIEDVGNGNMGARGVCYGLSSTLRGVEALAKLDELNIRGADLWLLWADVCNRDRPAMIELILTGDPVARLKETRGSSFYGAASPKP